MNKEVLFQWQNDWVQFRGKWNWITFRVLQLEVEKDMQIMGWTLTFVVLGVGFHVRYNTGEDTVFSVGLDEQMKDIEERLK